MKTLFTLLILRPEPTYQVASRGAGSAGAAGLMAHYKLLIIDSRFPGISFGGRASQASVRAWRLGVTITVPV